jgi:hypothetical protein
MEKEVWKRRYGRGGMEEEVWRRRRRVSEHMCERGGGRSKNDMSSTASLFSPPPPPPRPSDQSHLNAPAAREHRRAMGAP